MEYSDKEKQVLSLLNKADFKNISKNEVITIASKLGELDPEVAKEILHQYPEFVKLMQTTMTEYKNALDSIIASDDSSINEVYGILNKEMDDNAKSRSEFYELAGKTRDDLSKCLDKDEFSPEEKRKMLDQELEILKIANSKEEDIRKQQERIGQAAIAKDSEKREFNWKLVAGASLLAAFVAGVGGALLGGKFNIKPPKR